MDEEARNEYYRKFMAQSLGQESEPNPDPIEISDEEYNPPTDINLDDYVLADTVEESHESIYKNDINIINILTCYYKDTYGIEGKVSLFDGIESDDMSGTNKCMEFVYGEIFRFEKALEHDKDVLYTPDDEIDIKNYRELYCLMIDNEPKIMCAYTLPIASYLSSVDWLNIDWAILNIK